MAPYLWVVKTAKSQYLSRSEKKEQLKVFRHAQRTSRSAKKLRKTPASHQVEQDVIQVPLPGFEGECADSRPKLPRITQLRTVADLMAEIDEHAFLLLEMCTPTIICHPDRHEEWPSAESRGMKYFLEVSIHKIIDLKSEMHFWKGIVPCLAESHPGFRHLVVAIAATFELLFRPDSSSLNEFAMEQCNKAIRSILSAGELEKSWLLASCVLISAYNLLRSDLDAADRSIENGLKLLEGTATSDENIASVSRILTSLDKRHGFKLWAPDVTFQFDRICIGNEVLVIDPTLAQGPFVEISQVVAAFRTCIVDHVAKLMRNLAIDAYVDPCSLLAKDVRKHFSDVFFRWQEFYRSLPSDHLQTRLELKQLKIGLLSSCVLFGAKILSCSEMSADLCMKQFQSILDLGRDVIEARHAGKPVVYLDRIVNGQLYTAAMLCRDSVIRRELIALLKGQRMYEDGLVNLLRGRVAEIVADFEDEGRLVRFAREVPADRLVRVRGLYSREDRKICVLYMSSFRVNKQHLQELWSPIGQELDRYSIEEIEGCLQGMTAAYSMYKKADVHVAPKGCLRRMYYRGRPVQIGRLFDEEVSTTM
jgi:hypothetical protein